VSFDDQVSLFEIVQRSGMGLDKVINIMFYFERELFVVWKWEDAPSRKYYLRNPFNPYLVSEG
jgi:hypothetical protein